MGFDDILLLLCASRTSAVILMQICGRINSGKDLYIVSVQTKMTFVLSAAWTKEKQIVVNKEDLSLLGCKFKVKQYMKFVDENVLLD